MAHITASTGGGGGSGGKDAANMYRVGDYVSNSSSCRFGPKNRKIMRVPRF